MNFFCVKPSGDYEIVKIDDFHEKIMKIVKLATNDMGYNLKIFESVYGYRLISKPDSNVLSQQKINIYYVIDALSFIKYQVYFRKDKIVWYKAEQYRPLPNTIFGLMASISLYENSMHNLIDYHILVEYYS